MTTNPRDVDDATFAAQLAELETTLTAGLTLRKAYPSLPVLRANGTDVEAHWSDGAEMAIAECDEDRVAALIVAAVNALPTLLAALRGPATDDPATAVER